MSKYNQQPLEFDSLATVPIAGRGGKVRLEHMGSVHQKGDSAGQKAAEDAVGKLLGRAPSASATQHANPWSKSG